MCIYTYIHTYIHIYIIYIVNIYIYIHIYVCVVYMCIYACIHKRLAEQSENKRRRKVSSLLSVNSHPSLRVAHLCILISHLAPIYSLRQRTNSLPSIRPRKRDRRLGSWGGEGDVSLSLSFFASLSLYIYIHIHIYIYVLIFLSFCCC